MKTGKFKYEISIHALREEGDDSGLFTLMFGAGISIHALREEGDAKPPVRSHKLVTISIHALREEGDVGATFFESHNARFLSTPSARRATC